MSAGKLDRSNAFKPVVVHARQTLLSLSPEKIHVGKNGIEFHSVNPIQEYTEITLDIVSPKNGNRVHCNGVVVACKGNKHTGYNITVLFTGMASGVEMQLTEMVQATVR
ncbi:MAG: hypothetical protein N2487_00355 [Verrucomicrobiae bacterium]|nr:hypothetical protein [Verrucomicrobiae bacterium]